MRSSTLSVYKSDIKVQLAMISQAVELAVAGLAIALFLLTHSCLVLPTFEVWNEPGLHRGVDACLYPGDPTCGGDWWGSTHEYYLLYAHAARALKKAKQHTSDRE